MQKLIDDCERDPSCGGKFSSIRNDWETLQESFEQGSVSVVYSDSLDRRLVTLQRGPFFEAFRTLLLMPATQRQVPRIVHRAAHGDFAPFFKLIPPDSSTTSPFAEGLYLCVTCPEGTQRITADEMESETARTFLGRYRVQNQMEACDVWPTRALSEEVFTPVTANIPTLLLAGGMDYVSPVSWAQEVSSRLTDSRVVVIDYMGHIADGLDNVPCLDALIRAFLSAGTTAGLDASCVEAMTPPPFTVD
jgi:pimeloyl-ACP methyl ester carboxylesterase